MAKKYLPYILIFLLLLFSIISLLTSNGTEANFNAYDNNIVQLAPEFIKDILSYTAKHIPIPNGSLINYITSTVGFVITTLGFIFVIIQMSALNEQVNKQEEQYHKDSEFKNFLEATKILTCEENKYNANAQISAMYLLYDLAKKYPVNSLEKVIKVLNRYAIAVYAEIEKLDGGNRKITINEWKEHGKRPQQVASTALELNKKLFVYALEHKIQINLSDVIIFDLDVEKDLNNSFKLSNLFFYEISVFKAPKIKLKLFKVIKHSPRITFLCCNLSSYDGGFLKKEIDFSTSSYWSIASLFIQLIKINKRSVKSRMDISLSYFIECDLTECDFSYSNLWGVTFEDCQLYETKFKQAECIGAEFNETCDISEQLKQEQMLFIDKDIFDEFNCEYKRTDNENKLKYAIIYPKNKNCFQNTAEYDDKFINFRKEYSAKIKKVDTKRNMLKKFLCQKICKNMDM